MNYTLRNRGYYDVLKIIAEELESQGIEYALVGGAGVQARIADFFCKKQKTGISDAHGLEELLRETKDFDITSNASEADFIRYFNEIQALNPNVSVYHERARSKKIKFRGKEEVSVFLNYQTGVQDFIGLDEYFYAQCIETAEPIKLKYNGGGFFVKVATPECLVSSKLTRNDPKDIWDIGALMKSMKLCKPSSGKLRQGKIEMYLKRAKKEEIIGRLNEIKKQILKE